MAMTDEQLTSEYWVSMKSGCLFKISAVSGENETREVTYYRVGDAEGWTRPLAKFAVRFRVASKHEIFQALVNVLREHQSAGGDQEVGFLVEPDHRHELEHMVLYPETRQALQIGLNRVLRRAELEEAWQLSRIEPRANRCVLNLHGPPGTGKTMSAYAVAKRLNKKIYQVDYSQIISKWVGETAKMIAAAFESARRHEAILLFDEADSLMSKRIDMSGEAQSWATSINQNRNVFMQELDRHDGVVLMSTNKFGNFDEAFLRRVACHIPYRLPNQEMRVKLFKLHLPDNNRVRVDNWEAIGRASKNFSGGDILNVVVNAINRASLADDPAAWFLTTDDLLSEINRVAEAKKQHGSRVDGAYAPLASDSATSPGT
jgi:SpoVK/Ycf46/Vps4 family AAA+-type ATPase